MDLIAPVGSAAATRPLPLFADGGLSIGQLVQARVTRVDGDVVQLRWADQTVAVASKVPLTVGQQVSLLVEEGAAGKTLLRMVDETFGKARPTRTETPSGGRGTGTTGATAGGRQLPVTGLPGRAGRDPGDSAGGQSFEGGEPDWSGLGEPGGRAGGPAAQARSTGPAGAEPDPWRTGSDAGNSGLGNASLGSGGAGRTDGVGGGRPGTAGPSAAGTGAAGAASAMRGARATSTGGWAAGLPILTDSAAEGDPLATLLFEPRDGAAARLAGLGRSRMSDLTLGGPARTVTGSATAGPVGGGGSARPAAGAPAATQQATTSPGLVARAAMPAYGRLAQSVGGAVAFGRLMATLTQDVGQTLARAPLAPADLGRLLIDVGVHPDEMNAVLVGEILAQGGSVQESTIRSLRRELAAAGGTTRDAAPAVALSRLGLPITPLSLAVARQLQAGQLDPRAVWGELLPELQKLARFGGDSQPGVLAAELLADWQVPVHEGAEGIAQWLRGVVDQAATPLEAKLARPLMGASGEAAPAASGGQDARARLDLLSQTLPPAFHTDGDSLPHALQRLQATIQAEQILNGSATERAEPRFFAVTLPTIVEQRPSTLQIRVRERDAQSRGAADPVRPDVVQLKLSLPGLGELGVNLTVGQSSVACHFAAGSPFATALLTASAGELVGRLKRLGYRQTAVDAATEPVEVAAPLPAPAPRVSRVDMQA